MTGSASKAEKVPNFTKSTFPKKGVGKFSKNYISGITKASAFEWYASLVLSPPIPSNEPCKGDRYSRLPDMWHAGTHTELFVPVGDYLGKENNVPDSSI